MRPSNKNNNKIWVEFRKKIYRGLLVILVIHITFVSLFCPIGNIKIGYNTNIEGTASTHTSPYRSKIHTLVVAFIYH
jgi:hypothetical protein